MFKRAAQQVDLRMRGRVPALVSAAFDRVKTDAGGNEYNLECPFHGDKPNKPHLYLNRDTGLWICFRCEERGGFIKLVRKLAELDPSIDPNDHLAGLDSAVPWNPLVRLALPEVEIIPPPPFRSQPPPPGTVDLRGELSPMVEPLRRAGVRYLLSRGVSVEAAEERGARIGIAGRYAGRVMFPVCGREGEHYGWVARAFRKGLEPKVLNTPGAEGRSVDSVPFGLDIAYGRHKDVVLVEGVFDAVKHGTQFLAALGKRLTPLQRLAIVRSKFDSVTVLFDSDAKKYARATAQSLAMHVPRVFWGWVEGYKDPGEAPTEAVAAAILSAEEVLGA